MRSSGGHVRLMVVFGVFLLPMFTRTHFTTYTDTSFDNPEYHITFSLYDAMSTKLEDLKSKPCHCDWLPRCLCRDESDFTNGTYKLMVDCTQTGLNNIPDNIPNSTTVLTLDGNYIEHIKSEAFKNLVDLKYLDLSDNLIRKIHKDAFKGLKNLRTLELSGNQIHYDNESLPDSVFKPLTNLERLNLHQKMINVTGNEYYPTATLSQLTSLKQLLIDGIEPKNISVAFSRMPNLMILDLSSEYGRCNLKRIEVDMFEKLNGVYDLNINNCSLEFVENGSFAELTNLTILDLSYNEQLQFKSLANISSGLQGKYMRQLKLVKIHETFGDCTRLEKDHLVNFKDVKIDDLYLDNNRLAYVNEDAVEFIPRSLHKLSLTNNMLLAGEYIHKMFEKSVFENLRYLTLAEQSFNYDAVKFFNNQTRHMLRARQQTDLPYSPSLKMKVRKITDGKEHNITKTAYERETSWLPFCGNCHLQGVSYETILYIPPGLKDLDISGLLIRNELRNICFCEPNTLLRMNLERNVFWSWQGPIAGLSKLTSLNLAWNSCDDLSEDVFDQFESLIQLNLSRNFIERFLRNDKEGRIFRNLKKLFSLVLIDNKLSYIPPKLFQGLESLAILDLSFNFLTQIDLVFNRHPLQFLDLHYNLLENIGPSIIDKFQKDRDKNIPYRYLDLSHNRLSCACQDSNFMEWVSQTNVKFRGLSDYKCTYKNGSIENLINATEIYMRLSKDCADYTPVIVGACFGIVLFLGIVLGGIINRYKWDLRYLYYTIKLKMKGSKQFTNMDDGGEFKYDAFISYAHENVMFVMNSLITELENTRHLKLLVHGRDFLAGEYVYDNIMQAIKTSRKTLILMSKHFLKSEWCIFEMNMARLESIKTGRNAVCVVMLENVSISGLPLEIIDIIRQQTYLELPVDSQDNMHLWWDRVHNTLVSSS